MECLIQVEEDRIWGEQAVIESHKPGVEIKTLAFALALSKEKKYSPLFLRCSSWETLRNRPPATMESGVNGGSFCDYTDCVEELSPCC